jgi:hypothetical protein
VAAAERFDGGHEEQQYRSVARVDVAHAATSMLSQTRSAGPGSSAGHSRRWRCGGTAAAVRGSDRRGNRLRYHPDGPAIQSDMTRLLHILLVLAIAASPAGHAQDAGPPRILVDVTQQTPKSQVAVLMVNQSVARGRGFKCAVQFLIPVKPRGLRDPSRASTGKLPHGGALVVLKPGLYEVVVVYQTPFKTGHDWGTTTLEPGKTYAVNCSGETFNQMKVQAVEVAH